MDSVREFHRLEEALRQGKKIQGGGSDVCPLRPGFAICGQTGVGKSSAIAALYLAHLLTPEEYEEYQQDVRCWEDLECEQTLRALSMDNMSTRQITMPMRLYTDATLQFSQKASNMVLGDLQVFHNYGLPNQTYSAPRLDLPSIGGTGNVGSTLPAALSFGSEPQLLVIFMSEEELVDQLLLYLSYVGQQTLGKRNKDEVQAFKQLWDAVVKDEARDEQGQARLKMTVESMGQQYKPPLKPIVHEALGTSHLFRTRREGCKPDLYAELHFISLVQQLLMKRDAVERLRPSHRMCVELLKEEAKDGLWADCHGASELLAIQACVKVLDLFVPSHLLHAFNTKLEDSIGAGDGVKMRVQRQNAKEAVLDNMVVMLDRVLEGSDTVQKYLELSPFIQRWIRAGIHGCIGTPPQLAFMFIPERLDGLLNWEDAEDYYKYSKEGDRSNGSLLNAANVREFHEYLEKEVLAEKVATIRDNVRELFAKMIHTAEPDLSDNQRRDHVERLLQKVTIFYCLPFLGTMALHQLTSAGQHGQVFVKGFTHEHLENILRFSQLSTLMAILAGPWIRKKDEMYSKIRETADDEIRQAQERVATIDFMTARVMKISLKKKWSKASRELQNNLFGTDSNCMKEIQSGQRRCVSWLERRLQCLIPDWKDVESNTRRTLNRNYGLERLKVNERDLLEEYLRPEHELEHPCLPVARVLREEVASLVDALLRSELKPLILELHDHLKGMMTGPVTQTFQTYFCDDPGQYDTLKDILEPHLQSQLSRLLTRSNVRIKLDADTVKRYSPDQAQE
ncbi:hypothetical protein DUNSADRAFT_807 [Dunaliella salina]|uniref:Uncharacterized protein n=1 Tax=Dunaliella salina TaxID=3046 RepID=A0ABQ7GXS2_DUNSA|nr:hypothetical protein DUNSADRAFT_807 [Dunaliella salina]|eukprot:KAF5839405.1 hypothetical protein DUNSADRAFT_807 [Dunaliella salina]